MFINISIFFIYKCPFFWKFNRQISNNRPTLQGQNFQLLPVEAQKNQKIHSPLKKETAQIGDASKYFCPKTTNHHLKGTSVKRSPKTLFPCTTKIQQTLKSTTKIFVKENTLFSGNGKTCFIVFQSFLLWCLELRGCWFFLRRGWIVNFL